LFYRVSTRRQLFCLISYIFFKERKEQFKAKKKESEGTKGEIKYTNISLEKEELKSVTERGFHLDGTRMHGQEEMESFDAWRRDVLTSISLALELRIVCTHGQLASTDRVLDKKWKYIPGRLY
jgi:hypothetical protein